MKMPVMKKIRLTNRISRFLSSCTFSVICSPFILLFFGCGQQTDQQKEVVVYCALDREFSEHILQQFTKKTGIRVLPKFDTEANKSVGLVEAIRAESAIPRCDVFWNNEILGTIRLQQEGLLQPYQPTHASGFPAIYRAKDQTWHGFASRARIIIVNTDLIAKKDFPKSILDLTNPRWRRRIAMAKPQFGTTATHACCLASFWGDKRSEKFFRQLNENQVQIVAGNKQVAQGVGRGDFLFGLTDTDDALAEIAAGRPVEIIFPDQEGPEPMGTLFLPNTLAIVRKARNLENAKKLVDYLLSPEIEKKLADSASQQIPLHQDAHFSFDGPLRNCSRKQQMQIDFLAAANAWSSTQQQLITIFAK